MKHKRCLALLLLAALCLPLTGCQQTAAPAGDPPAATALPVEKAPTREWSDLTLTDKAELYTGYDPLEVPCFYVTVRKGTEADGTNHTFQEVNAYRNTQGMVNVQKIYADAIVQVGDETGPLPGSVGFDTYEPNATINVRGRTSTEAPQKSYRLTLNENAGLWYGQRAIALNKHPTDPTRIRNALYFKLLQSVPGMVSLRTRFVRLYVKDETADPPAQAFEDYGLYTQVELPNNRYLRNHELSRDGGLYKANMCELFRYPDQIKLATDPTYRLQDFDDVLEPKVNEDHEKLIEMLDAVNNYDLPIETVVEKYFDLDNLTSYAAFNILVGNEDSNAQNYFLYNPVNSDKWYYICWDGDSALTYVEDELTGYQWRVGAWTRGVGNYWGVVLYNRLLRVERYRQLLLDKMELLRSTLTPDYVRALVAEYRQVAEPFTSRLPDAVNLLVERSMQEKIYETLPDNLDRAYQYFLESFRQPMPFYLGDAEVTKDGLVFSWDAAYNFKSEFVYYTLAVATDWSFSPESLVYQGTPQLSGSSTLPLPSPGVYYWRVMARNESGYTQTAFDQVITGEGIHSGMRRFTVASDGTVTNTP